MRSVRDRGDMQAAPISRLSLGLAIVWKRLGSYGRAMQAWPLPSFPVLAVSLLGSTAVYGAALGGHAPAILDWASEPFGFALDRVDVTGNAESSQIDILQAVWMGGAATLPALDVASTRQAIEEMPWVESATVSKIYPNTLSVEIVEKAPYAVWQRGAELTVIDRDGGDIVPFSTTRFTELPLVVGTGADREAADLIDRIEIIPELTPRIRAYVLVAERRWDLHLTNGVVVKLPEVEPIEAAAELVRMDRDTQVLSRDIVSVDLRVPDRVVVKLTPEAKERRDAALKERERLLKQASARDKPA